MFKKNKSKAPMTNLMIPCPRKRIGFIGVPINNSNKINATITDTTVNGSNEHTSPSLKSLVQYRYVHTLKKEQGG